ncbi:MAG: CHAT domain-containing protein [Candidatus Omnitrophica bacterium]|nr:CHAT domain-containing protein [Candidatus Omnitrophota bacterium]
MQSEKGLVLEISRQDDLLKMSIFDSEETASTLKRYSQHKIDFSEIDKLCHEITSVWNKAQAKDSAIIKNLQKTGQALWDHLLSRSVKERLKASEVLNLALVIDEELINIPWEVLYDGQNFLCLSFNIGRQVRTKSQAGVLQYRNPTHIYKMLILANPTDDLKAAYAEGLNIKNQFSRSISSMHVDFKSTNIDKLYVKKNFCDYDIVHFAGHCEYVAQNPKNSGWVLSDGKFSIQDILSMGQAASLPTLVFSNACHSAQAGVEVIIEHDYQRKNYSLAAAFLFSGVRHYIGSIRRIEDCASLTFAKEFYHCLIHGRSVGESVRLARVKLVNEYGIISLHWANYLLYGDPGFVIFKPKQKSIKPRHKLKLSKKWIPGIILLVSIFLLSTFFYLWLPTTNPGAYYLYLKANKLFAKGKNEEVFRLGEQIISKDKSFAEIYHLLADTYYRTGDKEKALNFYFTYALLVEKKQDTKSLLSAYIEIGWFYQLEGEYAKALDFYNKALNLAVKHGDKLNEAIALRKLAVWHTDKKDYDTALVLLTKSTAINLEHQHLYAHRYNLACDYFDIGLVFANKDDYGTAQQFYRKSQALFEKLALKHELSDYYFNLGELYLYEKQYQKALDSYLSGLRIDQLQGNKVNLASDYNMIGELYMEMDRSLEAEEALKQAVIFATQVHSRLELAAAERNLGLLFKKLGKKSKAREHLRQAQEIYSSLDLISYKEVKAEILSLETQN